MRRLIIIALFLLPLLTQGASVSQKLHHIKQEINHTKAELKLKQKAEHQLLSQLKTVEVKISHLSKQTQQTHNRLKLLQWSIQSLQLKQQQLQDNLHTQRLILADQIRATYMIKPQSKLKILLGQQDASNIDRYLTYADYLNRYQKKLISALHQTQAELTTTTAELTYKQAELKQQQQEQSAQKALLQQQYHQRQMVLSGLKQQIFSKKAELQQLANNQTHLQTVLDKLRHSSKYTANYFTSHRGKLHWPTRGRIITEFNSPIEQSRVHWHGVILDAKTDAPVKAAAPGKVLFSDWMRGFGLVLIIDHGNGYLTIYGRNNSLQKSVGEFVKADEIIATVGQSGGYRKPTLYFSVRHRTKALNPRSWCVLKGSTVKRI